MLSTTVEIYHRDQYDADTSEIPFDMYGTDHMVSTIFFYSHTSNILIKFDDEKEVMIIYCVVAPQYIDNYDYVSCVCGVMDDCIYPSEFHNISNIIEYPYIEEII